jgi:hypothetical protein
MARSTVFTSNRSPAVRLPKAVAFPDDMHQVDISEDRLQPRDRATGSTVGRALRQRPARQQGFHGRAWAIGGRRARAALMFTYMLDTNVCIYVHEELSAGLARQV